MSETSFPAQTPPPGAKSLGSTPHDYRLSDDLARLCLPQEYKDSYRNLAWVNSICVLFLVVGLVGLKPPRVYVRPVNEASDVVPVVFTPPEEQPKVQPEVKPEDQDQPKDTPEDTPQVAQVVAAADSSSVAFAVPVQGAVAIASEARMATPPPLSQQAPPPAAPKPLQFNPNAGGGVFPEPEYPGMAVRNKWQGTVIIEILVDPGGRITDAKVQKTSGISVLDDAALSVVKNRWRFMPTGKPQWLYWPCKFQLQ